MVQANMYQFPSSQQVATIVAQVLKQATTKQRGKKPRARRSAYTNNQQRIVVKGTNPHRKGTARYKAFEAARKAPTVAAYAATGFKTKYLKRWQEAGLLALRQPGNNNAQRKAA